MSEYARSTGKSEMRAEFRLESVPASGAKLRVVARHAGVGAAPAVKITVNGIRAFEGPSPFLESDWTARSFDLPASALRQGTNELTIENTEPTGPLGMPPWFMVAEAELLP